MTERPRRPVLVAPSERPAISRLPRNGATNCACTVRQVFTTVPSPSLPPLPLPQPSPSSRALNYLPPHKARSDSDELTRGAASSVIDRSAADLTAVDDGCGRDRPHAEISQYAASLSFFFPAAVYSLWQSAVSFIPPKQSGLNPSPGPAVQINSPNKQQ